MKNKYSSWISENTAHLPIDDIVGRCKEYCDRMLQQFPELKLTKGHVYIGIGDRKEWTHWWLVDPETNEIVDPTASQFPCAIGYVEWGDQPEPVGKCQNCGEYCFEDPNFCCRNCEIEYMAYLTSPED